MLKIKKPNTALHDGEVYVFNSRKSGRMIHIRGAHGRTWCNLENSTAFDRVDAESDEIPIHRETGDPRRVCGTCISKRAYAIRKQVEAIAPAEPLTTEELADLHARPISQPTEPKVIQSAKAEQAFYSSMPWLRLRFETIRAYGGICMLCNSTKFIAVDHIKPRSKYPELELDPDNVQVLCNTCNRGKSNKDMTDFRTVNLSAQIRSALANDEKVEQESEE